MGLYLCIYDEDDEELDGVEIGSYADFGVFRDAVARLEPSKEAALKRFPLLLGHSDCDGEWEWEEIPDLERELARVKSAFDRLPPIAVEGNWQRQVANELKLDPRSLAESFFDVDGEPLLERLLGLCKIARAAGRPITFQ